MTGRHMQEHVADRYIEVIDLGRFSSVKRLKPKLLGLVASRLLIFALGVGSSSALEYAEPSASESSYQVARHGPAHSGCDSDALGLSAADEQPDELAGGQRPEDELLASEKERFSERYWE